ncbi:MAG: hypothetical protein QM820_32345 [Minicystis sp.]
MNSRDASEIVRQGGAVQSDHGDAARRQTRRNVLAALEWAGRRAAEWERVILCDRVALVAPLFTAHVRELEAHAATAAGLGAGAGAVLGAWGASRHEAAMSVNALLKSAVVGAALGAAGGFVAGRAYERAYGPLRPRVAAALPLWAEDRLRRTVIAHLADGACLADVPAWHPGLARGVGRARRGVRDDSRGRGHAAARCAIALRAAVRHTAQERAVVAPHGAGGRHRREEARAGVARLARRGVEGSDDGGVVQADGGSA